LNDTRVPLFGLLWYALNYSGNGRDKLAIFGIVTFIIRGSRELLMAMLAGIKRTSVSTAYIGILRMIRQRSK
jgi:hypothetical protein